MNMTHTPPADVDVHFDYTTLNTFDDSNHYRQAAFLMDMEGDSRMDVQVGDILEVEVSIDEVSGVFCRLLGIKR